MLDGLDADSDDSASDTSESAESRKRDVAAERAEEQRIFQEQVIEQEWWFRLDSVEFFQDAFFTDTHILIEMDHLTIIEEGHDSLPPLLPDLIEAWGEARITRILDDFFHDAGGAPKAKAALKHLIRVADAEAYEEQTARSRAAQAVAAVAAADKRAASAAAFAAAGDAYAAFAASAAAARAASGVTPPSPPGACDHCNNYSAKACTEGLCGACCRSATCCPISALLHPPRRRRAPRLSQQRARQGLHFPLLLGEQCSQTFRSPEIVALLLWLSW